jgi:sugar O-acyltransferase (sialic acid O-acetyltransferase NeuD family)
MSGSALLTEMERQRASRVRLEPLILLGTGGNACDILDIVEAINAACPTWDVVGFLDDMRERGSEYLGLPVLGRLADASRHEAWLLNAIGSDKSYRHRPRIMAGTGAEAGRFATLVHPAASVSARARLGHGVYVNYGVSVAGRVVVGDHVSLGAGCIVGHDTQIEDYAIVAPGAVVSGGVQVGRASYIGAASCIRQQIRIGAEALVGMGAVVVKDVTEGAVMVGNPARPLSEIAGKMCDIKELTYE